MTIGRREFLKGGLTVVGAAGLAPVLAACGGSSIPGPPATPPATLTQLVERRREDGGRQDIAPAVGGEDYVAGIDNYLAVGLIDQRAGLPFGGESVTLYAYQGVDGSGAGIGPLKAPWFAYTNPDPDPSPKGVNAVAIRFPTEGRWWLYAETMRDSKLHFGTTAIEVKPRGKATTQLVGESAFPTQTPTVRNARGVDPICTRVAGICPFHSVSLADALKAGKPVAFTVGTPKFCTSRTCGPNLEELITVSRTLGDTASFVHAEVYINDEAQTIQRQIVTPAFRQWGLRSEPWLFLIGTDRRVAARFEGPVTAPQIEQSLRPLITA